MTAIYFFVIICAIVLVLMSVEMLVNKTNVLYIASALFLFLFALALGGRGLYGYLLSLHLQEQIFFVIRSRNAAIHLLAPALFFMSCYFPRGEYRKESLKWIPVVAAVSIVFSILSLSGADVFRHSFQTRSLSDIAITIGITVDYKPFHWILLGIDALFGVFILAGILLRYKKVELIYQKKQIRYFVTAMAALSAGMGLVAATVKLLPEGVRMILLGVISILFGAAFLYSIVNYRFINIRKSLVRLLREAAISAVIVLPIVLVLYMLRQWSATIPPLGYFAVYTVALVVVMRFYNSIMRLVRIYFRMTGENRDFTSEIMDRVGKARTLEEFAKSLCDATMDTINCRNAEFLAVSDDKQSFRCLYSGSGKNYEVSAHEGFVKILSKDVVLYERELIAIDPRYSDIKTEAEDYFSRYEVSILVPFWFEDELTAMLNIAVKYDNSGWTSGELSIISRIRSAASIALSALLMNERDREVKVALRELDLASNIQNSIFQKEIPVFKRMDVSAYLKPMKWVSGDYYLVEKVDEEKLALVVADVSGKGFPAALVAMMIHTVAKSQEFGYTSPSAVVTKINDVMTSNFESGAIRIASFATIFCGIIDDRERTVTYTNAGHYPMIVLDRDTDKAVWLGSNAKPAGIFREEMFPSETHHFFPGQIFVVYSDGITEMTGEGDEEYGEERLLEAVRSNKDLPASEIVAAVLRDVEVFSAGKEQMDDMTLVVVKV